MLTFLAPMALIGLSLLAIPIIVHLLKPRKVRRTPFSSLRWLRVTQQRLARRIRWHQILLFLLRAAFIVLLVLALARPILVHDGEAAPCERFVVVDVSRSMSYRGRDGASPFERAQRQAAVILAGERGGDRTALLATGDTTKVLAPLAHGAAGRLQVVATLQTGVTDTDLGSAADVLRPMLSQCRPDSRTDIFFITDNYQGNWRQNAIESLMLAAPKDLRVTVVDVAEPAAQNGWIADCRLATDDSAGMRALQVQVRCVGSTSQRTVRLVGMSGLSERSQVVTIEPGRATQVTFELPPEVDIRGKSAEISLEPADDLPGDDRWFVALDDEASLQVLLVEGSIRSGSPLPTGFALRTAIEALSTPAAKIQLKSAKFNEMQPADLHQVDVVLMTDVPELSNSVLEAIQERVHRGVGLAIFLGPGVDAPFYNLKLVDPLDRHAGLLPLPLDRAQEVPSSRGGLAPWQSFQWHHPLLTGLFDPALGDLAQVHSRSYYRFVGVPGDSDAVLATVGDAPAIIEHSVGAGKVVLLNATADDAWSDLPRHKSFVPLVDRLLDHLSGGKMRRIFAAGSQGTLSCAPPASGETISVITPGGRALTPVMSAVGNRALLHLPALVDPGVYRVQYGNRSAPDSNFIVQVGRGDSLLAPIDPDLLKAWWQPATFILDHPDTATSQDEVAAAISSSLTTLLIALACSVLAIEMFLVHWLCPRANPASATSLVQRKQQPAAPTASVTG